MAWLLILFICYPLLPRPTKIPPFLSIHSVLCCVGVVCLFYYLVSYEDWTFVLYIYMYIYKMRRTSRLTGHLLIYNISLYIPMCWI